MSAEDFRKEFDFLNQGMEDLVTEGRRNQREVQRVSSIIDNTPKILDDLDEEFCRRTKLTKQDVAFLFLATGLQLVRQYLLTQFPERLDDKTSAEKTFGHVEEHSNRHHRRYRPSLDEIISNPVPFDANIGAEGALSGGGRMGHRVTAIGHDPVVGLVVGTANIATSTLTTHTLASYHIYSKTLSNGIRDVFNERASTTKVFSETADKLINQGLDGKAIVGMSLVKEIIHLKSDLNTTHSLPLPFVSLANPQLASTLASYGLDMANVVTVGKQMTYSIMINTLVAMIHGLFYVNSIESDRRIYEVRTRKILSYSNLIASTVNLAVVAGTEDLSKLDIGGIAVTIFRLITDQKFITQVKHDFIFGTYQNMIMGDL